MNIKIYTIPACPYCLELKNMLDDNNIIYEIVDVSLDENQELFNQLVEISGSESVPMVTIGVHLLAPNVNFSTIKQCFELILYILKNDGN